MDNGKVSMLASSVVDNRYVFDPPSGETKDNEFGYCGFILAIDALINEIKVK